jgi:hypothetical protein
MEVLIAVGATGSGVAGLAVWTTDYGTVAWGLISTISILLATIKPPLKLTEKVEAYAKLYGEYTGAYIKMSVHLQDLQLDRAITDQRLKSFSDLRLQAAELEPLGDPVLDRALIQRLEIEVNRAIPIEKLWFPNNAGIESADPGLVNVQEESVAPRIIG